MKNMIKRLADDIFEGYKSLKDDSRFDGISTNGEYVSVNPNNHYRVCAIGCAVHNKTGLRGKQLRSHIQDTGLSEDARMSIHALISPEILKESLSEITYNQLAEDEIIVKNQHVRLHNLIVDLNDQVGLSPDEISKILKNIYEVMNKEELA